MSVNIVFGRSGTGKSEDCFAQIKACVEQGNGPVLLLVPEQLSYYAEKKMVQTIGYTCMGRAEVLSFERLAHRYCPVSTKNSIDNAGKSMIIEHSLQQLSSQFSYFTNLTKKPGFLADIVRQIQEFEHYQILPEQLETVLQQETVKGNLKNKLEDLILLYRYYQEKMQGYYDADQHLTVLAQYIAIHQPLAGYHIFLDEFSDFLPQYFSVIKAMIKAAAEVTFYICAAKEPKEKFKPGLGAMDDIIALCREQNVAFTIRELTHNKRHTSNESLCFLEKNYPNISCAPYEEDTKAIRLYCYDNLYAEVEACAQRIWHLCKEHAYRLLDIAVACTNLEDYLPFIRVIFRQYHLAYYADMKQSASQHPVVLVLRSLFTMLEQNYQTESVISYLKTGLLSIETADVYALENFALARGIRYQKWVNEDWWKKEVQKAKESNNNQDDLAIEHLNEVRQSIFAPILHLKNKIEKSDHTVLTYATLLFEFMNEIHLPENIETQVQKFQKEGQLDLADEYTKIYDTILTVLDECVLLFGEETMPFQDFSHQIDHAFLSYEISTIPQRLDCVEVGDCVRSKVKDKKCLFVLGAVSGALPSGKSIEGILSDRERRLLSQEKMVLAKDALAKASDEEFLVYRLLTAPSESLILSMPLATFDQAAQRPSEVILHIKKMFPRISLLKDDIDLQKIDLKRFIQTGPAFLYSVLGAKNTFYDFVCDQGYLDMWNYFASHEDYKQSCQRVYAATSYSVMSKTLPKDLVEKLYQDDLYTSVHRLEKFKQCPYSYFSEFVLQLKERKILKATGQSYGTLIHELVERFCHIVMEQKNNFHSLSRDECKQTIQKVVEETIAKDEHRDIQESSRFQFLVQRLKEVLFYIIWIMIEQMNAGDFSVWKEELFFGDGKEGAIPALHIPVLANQQVIVSGYIDRVDIAHVADKDVFRIIDYKSYHKNFDFYQIYEGVDIQLMLYLDAFWEHTGKMPAGMYYFKMLDNKLLTNGPIAEEEYMNSLRDRYQLEGVTIGDENIIRANDHSISGQSHVINVGYTQKGELTKSSMVASADQFMMLRKHVRHIVSSIGKEIFAGNIAVAPMRIEGALTCQYCSYQSVCGFEEKRYHYQIRDCQKRKPLEILNIIDEKIEKSKENLHEGI